MRLNVATFVLSSLGNSDLILGNVMASLKVPVVIQHGSNDALASPSVVAAEQKLIQHPTVKFYANAGHIPFILAESQFNRDLARWLETSVR